MIAGSLRVVTQAEPDRWWRIYEVSSCPAVELGPARNPRTPVSLGLTLHSGPDGTGTRIARREQTFELTANACNAFSMELEISDG